MDAVFSLDKGGFKSTVNHIALYRREPSPYFKSIAEAAVAAVRSKPSDFQIWDVPDLSSRLGKSIPIDVHGGHIFFDEAAVAQANLKPSVIRYQIIAGALRSKAGGRRSYDMRSMNTAIACGAVSGGAFLYFGQKRWRWMMTRPYLRVFASAMVCIAVTSLVRVTTRSMGLGTYVAQKNFTKAIDLMQCGVCLNEVREFTEKQIEDIGHYQIPKMPTGDEVPDQVKEVIKKGNEAHSMMLGINARTMKIAASKCKDKRCEWHKDAPMVDESIPASSAANA